MKSAGKNVVGAKRRKPFYRLQAREELWICALLAEEIIAVLWLAETRHKHKLPKSFYHTIAEFKEVQKQNKQLAKLLQMKS